MINASQLIFIFIIIIAIVRYMQGKCCVAHAMIRQDLYLMDCAKLVMYCASRAHAIAPRAYNMIVIS